MLSWFEPVAVASLASFASRRSNCVLTTTATVTSTSVALADISVTGRNLRRRGLGGTGSANAATWVVGATVSRKRGGTASVGGNRGCCAKTLLAGQCRSEIRTARVSIISVFREHFGDNAVEFCQFRSALADLRGRRGQVLGDDYRRVGVLIRRRLGQQVKRGAAKAY